MLYGSANRDESEFGQDAGRLDVRREAPRHLGFSSGPHFCIGSHLAKLQAKVALEELLAAYPQIGVDRSRGVRHQSAFTRGWQCATRYGRKRVNMSDMRSLIGVLLAVGLIAVAPTPANAEGASYADAGGDVWAHRGGTSVQEPAHTDGDVKYTSVQHRRRIIRVFMTVSSIDADSGSHYRPTLFRFTLINGRGLMKVFDLNADNVLSVRKKVDGRLVASSCRWTHHAVNRTSARIALTIPRSCLRRPKIVRLQATVFDTDLDNVNYVDDAYTVYDSTNPAIKAGSSPWVKRG